MSYLKKCDVGVKSGETKNIKFKIFEETFH